MCYYVISVCICLVQPFCSCIRPRRLVCTEVHQEQSIRQRKALAVSPRTADKERLAGKALQMTAFLVNLVWLFIPQKALLSGHLLLSLQLQAGKTSLFVFLWESDIICPLS